MRRILVGLAALVGQLTASCGPGDSPSFPDLAGVEPQAPSAQLSYSGAYVTSFIECAVQVWTSTPWTSCRSASQPYLGTGVNAALITQQCALACLDALPPVYDARGGWFIVNVRIRNAGRQAIGTADGVTAASRGTALVLLETPRSLAGVGTVGVLDPKHHISAHPSLPQRTLYSFFGGIIRPTKTTEWRPWLFRVPQSVQRFAFRVAIVTDVEPLVKITEIMPGLKNAQGVITAGAMVELQNVGAAPIGNTTLLVLDSLGAGRATGVAGVPVGMFDEWRPGERRVVAARGLERVLVPPLAGWFADRYVFDPARQHRLRVLTGGRSGRVLDEVIIYERTVALGGISFERSWREMGVSPSKLFHPAWTSTTTTASTRCAGQQGCPVLRATPGR